MADIIQRDRWVDTYFTCNSAIGSPFLLFNKPYNELVTFYYRDSLSPNWTRIDLTDWGWAIPYTNAVRTHIIRFRRRDLIKIHNVENNSSSTLSNSDFKDFYGIKSFYHRNGAILTNLDISNSFALQSLLISNNSLVTLNPNVNIDISTHPNIQEITLERCRIPTGMVDKIYADAVAHGKYNGYIWLSNSGTPAGNADRMTLIQRNWNIMNNL